MGMAGAAASGGRSPGPPVWAKVSARCRRSALAYSRAACPVGCVSAPSGRGLSLPALGRAAPPGMGRGPLPPPLPPISLCIVVPVLIPIGLPGLPGLPGRGVIPLASSHCLPVPVCLPRLLAPAGVLPALAFEPPFVLALCAAPVLLGFLGWPGIISLLDLPPDRVLSAHSTSLRLPGVT